MNISGRKLAAWTSRALFGALFVVTLGVIVRDAVAMDSNPGDVALTAALLAAPLLLIFFALDVLVESIEQKVMTDHLSPRLAGVLRWTPRIGVLIFAAFMSLFALDVFGQGSSLWETTVGLMMHLIPTALLLVVLLVAWRWPWVGGVAFLIVAGFFVWQFGGGWGGDWSLYLLFVGTPALMGALFLANWWLRDDIGTSNTGIGAT